MSFRERSLLLLNSTRFFTLASRSPAGLVWATTLNYVPAFSPLRIIWSSPQTARHSENIRHCPQVSGSVFRTDLQGISPVTLDGAQFSGLAREIPEHEYEEIHDYFSRRNFPDETQRKEWMLPMDEFTGEGRHRFYEIEIAEWWLLDIDKWLATRQDGRIAIDPGHLRDTGQ